MKKLTPRERGKDWELERRILAADIPAYFETEEGEGPELLIRQDFEAYESMVFNVIGGTGLILPLRITPNVPVFMASGFDISLARWPNVWFRPLEGNSGRDWPQYQFHGRSELKFGRGETMNRFIAEHTEFRRGHPLHGLLLALSTDPMPADIVRGEKLDGTVKIVDQFEHGHCAKILLRVDREAEPTLKLNHKRPRLFARRDPWPVIGEEEMDGGW